jgi:hypothetical protein
MGFARYYTIKEKFDPEIFARYSKSCKDLCEQITNEWNVPWHSSNFEIGDGGGGPPIFSDIEVYFNGSCEEESLEDFIISINSIGFNSVKTRLKPYDVHVEACLILATMYFGDNIEISSDDIQGHTTTIYDFVKLFFRNRKISEILD